MRSREALSVAALLLAVVAPAVTPHPAAGQRTPDTHVLILTTGGTIASRREAPNLSGDSLVSVVPELREHARITVEEFSRIGSSQMTPANWLALSKRVDEHLRADRDLTGVVITHGTDTMEETAFFLNVTVRDTRPVVLVGSMRSATEISADGPANLLNAVRVAVTPEAAGKGVLVVLNEDVASARDVWKTDNRRVDTFRSPELGFLGFADPDAVTFYREPTRPHSAESEFDVRRIEELPAVPIVSDYTGFDGVALEEAATRGARGVVLATFAGGRMSAGARRAVQAVAEAGTPVVIASRVPGGRIVGNPAASLGAVVARDLPPHKARILLMLALTRTSDTAGIQRIFDRY